MGEFKQEEIAVSATPAPARRAGGRASRLAARAAALPEHIKPVRPGLEGGKYNPLSEADVLRIHNAALDALEQIGLADAPQSGIDAMVAAGADYRDGYVGG